VRRLGVGVGAVVRNQTVTVVASAGSRAPRTASSVTSTSPRVVVARARHRLTVSIASVIAAFRPVQRRCAACHPV